MLTIRIRFFTILAILFFAFASKGQVSIGDSISVVDFPFVNYEADTLINARYLAPFFDKLLKLENGDTNQISILHIGDSHIQSDFLTSEVRRNLQLRFGNAGRGLVFPLKVAGSREPEDYRSSSKSDWAVAKINSPTRYPVPGISGISMRSVENSAYFDIITYNHDDLDYSFNQITLIHAKDSLQFDCRITDSPEKKGYLMSAQPDKGDDCITIVPFGQPSNYLRIKAEQTESGQSSITINGVILQNNKPGIIYNSVGINDAHFNDYNNSPLFFSQLKILKPDLVIISLGTNEGSNIKVNENEIVASVGTLLKGIKAAYPGVCLLIATPADNYFRKKYVNPYLETVERALMKTADHENVACWDMYSVTGGFGSCSEWNNADMLLPDGIHYSKKGYILQGSLLYKALVDGYMKYIAE